MEKDIVDEGIERVRNEQAKAEEKTKEEKQKKAYIEAQKEREKLIRLYFPELGKNGILSLKFIPAGEPIEEGKFYEESDTWVVEFSIQEDLSEFFSEFEQASGRLWELYRKHNLKENRIAYIDKDIAQEEITLRYWRKELGIGLIGYATAAGIIGVIAAIQMSNVLIGIAIAFVIACIVIGMGAGDKIKNVRIHKRKIEQLEADKTISGF